MRRLFLTTIVLPFLLLPALFAAPEEPKRVRVLFADAPTREYQFVRTLLAREVEKGRAELTIYLPGAKPGTVQDVPAERLLKRFPDALDGDGKEKLSNLAAHDLIIAFDADWGKLSKEQTALVEKWVDNFGGGLILVAGGAHTQDLARADVEKEKLRPIRELCPVLPADVGKQGLAVEGPRRLEFPGATQDHAFLKLDPDEKEPLAGWEKFFTGEAKGDKKALLHGFHGYYPVESVKPAALVIASISEPKAKGKRQPFLVATEYGAGRVVWLGSGETWRLRQTSEKYYDRFWTELARFAAPRAR